MIQALLESSPAAGYSELYLRGWGHPDCAVQQPWRQPGGSVRAAGHSCPTRGQRGQWLASGESRGSSLHKSLINNMCYQFPLRLQNAGAGGGVLLLPQGLRISLLAGGVGKGLSSFLYQQRWPGAALGAVPLPLQPPCLHCGGWHHSSKTALARLHVSGWGGWSCAPRINPAALGQAPAENSGLKGCPQPGHTVQPGNAMGLTQRAAAPWGPWSPVQGHGLFYCPSDSGKGKQDCCRVVVSFPGAPDGKS